MTYIEPLNLGVWLVQVFAESQTIFTAVAIIVIFGMAAYFRMNGLTIGIMFLLFVIFLGGLVPGYFYFVGMVLIGLVIGFWIRKLIGNY